MNYPIAVQEQFPYIKIVEEIQYFEVRVEAYSTIDGELTYNRAIFLARAESRDDILEYIKLTYSEVGSIKIRKLDFVDLRMSREGDPIDSH